tara:strand:+ start:219 stop:380 length:162 start_codon:yes stop_codon:yes gene_type:complete
MLAGGLADYGVMKVFFVAFDFAEIVAYLIQSSMEPRISHQKTCSSGLTRRLTV